MMDNLSFSLGGTRILVCFSLLNSNYHSGRIWQEVILEGFSSLLSRDYIKAGFCQSLFFFQKMEKNKKK